jgi:hypothetical protein
MHIGQMSENLVSDPRFRTIGLMLEAASVNYCTRLADCAMLS